MARQLLSLACLVWFVLKVKTASQSPHLKADFKIIFFLFTSRAEEPDNYLAAPAPAPEKFEVTPAPRDQNSRLMIFG